jgi:hypothetical protein
MESLKPFSYLKNINYRSTLSHISGIYDNVADPANPLMECVFVRLDVTHDNLSDMFDGFPKTWDSSYLSVRIATRYLPCLCVGEVYLEGKKTRHSRLNNNDGGVYEFDIDLNQPPKETTLGKSLGQEFFGKTLTHLKESPIKELNGSLNTTRSRFIADLKDHRLLANGSRVKLIFSEIEILRFYYAKSDKLTEAIFKNHFSDENIPVHITNELHEKRELKNGKFRFVYRHGFNKADAIVLARILSSDTALSGVRRVSQTITTDQANKKSLYFLRTDFPFQGKSTIKVRGRLGVINDNDVFIVHQILSCSGAFPFSELSYCAEISRGNPNPHGMPMGMKPSPPRILDENKPNEEKGESTSTDGPNKDLKPLTLKIATSSFSAIDRRNIKYEKLRDSTHTSGERKPPHPAHTGNDVSSGSPKKNGNGKSKQKIVDESFLAIPTTNLKNIIQAMRNSILSTACKTIKSLTLSDGIFIDLLGEALIPFPVIMCRVINKKRIFSFVDESYKVRRRLLCFQIEYKKNENINYLYILEAEERYTSTKLPTLLLYQKNMEIIEKDMLESLLMWTVRNQDWPRYESHPELNTETLFITDNSTSSAMRLLSRIEAIAQ